MSNYDDSIVIRIAGEGGEGVISAGELLALAFLRSGLEVYTFRTYPAEIKGGPAMVQVRAGTAPVVSQGDKLDVLVAFNAEACALHCEDMREDGVLIYDPQDFAEVQPQKGRKCPISLTKISIDEVGARMAKNVVALGVMGRSLGLALEALEQIVESRFKRRPETLEKNLAAVRAGYAHGVECDLERELLKPVVRRMNGVRLLMSGNDALAYGAIAAGCRYYAGYPITPASDLMERLASELPRFGGALLQTEDEIAAISSAIGASYAGMKAMTATSGPGLSLMVEMLGYATMAEIPIVVVDAQRSGPSTGMPTKTEQSDLFLAAYGAHGDARRIVLAPGDVEECFRTIIDAFNLAEKYQGPVIVLSDQSLAHRTQSFPKPDLAKLRIIDRLTPRPDDMEGFLRYRVTESGISPMSLPGLAGGEYVATGLEHNEKGNPSWNPRNHSRMTAKRLRKLELAAAEPGFTERIGPTQAKIGVISWGSTTGAVKEALAMAEAEGVSAAALHCRMVSPLPEGDIGSFLESVEAVIVPELNMTNQFASMLQSAFCRRIFRVSKVTGLPFLPSEIMNAIKEVAEGGEHAGLQDRTEADLVPGVR